MAQRVSPAQLDYLMDFLEQRKDLALGRVLRGNEGREESKRLWNQLAEGINSLGIDGCIKTGNGWRLYFNDFKHKVSKKIKKMKSEISATGGGKRKEIILSPCEDRLFTILGRDLGEPITGVRLNPLDHFNTNTADVDITVVDGDCGGVELVDACFDDGSFDLASPVDASMILDGIESGNMTIAHEADVEAEHERAVPKKKHSNRKRKNKGENALPPSCPRDTTEVSQAQAEFRKTEEISANSRIILAEAVNNMASAINNVASAIREIQGVGVENPKGKKKKSRIIYDSDSSE